MFPVDSFYNKNLVKEAGKNSASSPVDDPGRKHLLLILRCSYFMNIASLSTLKTEKAYTQWENTTQWMC